MTTIIKPKVTVNKLPASLPVGLEEQRILVINQKLATGSSTSGQLYENVEKINVKSLFGEGSFLQNALYGIFDVFERSGSTILPKVDVIPLDDAGAGVQASATITVTEIGGATNLATVAGDIDIIIGSEYNYTSTISIAVDQAIVSGAGNISDAIADAINAYTELPVIAVNVGGVITLTCRHKGTVGNSITVKTRGLSLSGANYVLGNVAVAITAFASGATNPTLTTVLDVVGNQRYQTITHPSEYGIVFSVTDFLDDRFNVNNDILDGVCIIKDTDTLVNLKSALNALNSQSLVYLCDKTMTSATHKGSAIVDLDFVLSARVAGERALRLTEGANITRITLASSTASNDGVGGKHIATLNYSNTPVFSVIPIDTGIGFTEIEIEELKTAGGSVIGNNVVNNQIILGEMLTTYKTDAGANPDSTWKYLNTVDTLSVSAEYFFNNIKSDFSQSRLTEGDLVEGYSIVNQASFKGQLKKYYIDLADDVIVPAGKQYIDYFMENTSVILDMVNGKITSTSNLPIVVQLREILVNLKTTFSI